MAELYAERQIETFEAIQEKWKVNLITKYGSHTLLEP